MDDKKLNELLTSALASLTEEQKKKVKSCKTAKELVDYLSAEGVELPDEVLDAAAGGKIYERPYNTNEGERPSVEVRGPF